MTDRQQEPVPRADLRSLDLDGDGTRLEGMVQAVMHRVRSDATQHTERLDALLRIRRYLLAAAAVLAAIAVGSVFTTRRSPAVGGLDAVASWAESRHVPTNGELLAAYQGYRP